MSSAISAARPRLEPPSIRGKLTFDGVIERLSDWIVEAARSGKSGELADLLFLLDTDGCLTFNNKTGLPWVADDLQSRIHPWIARGLISLSMLTGVAVRTSTGGKADRTGVVYGESYLAGRVNADCGYGTQEVDWDEKGNAVTTNHPYSEHIESLWDLAMEFLNDELTKKYPQFKDHPGGHNLVETRRLARNPTRNTFDGQAVWFDNKGVQVAVHDRSLSLKREDGTPMLPGLNDAIREGLEKFAKSEMLQTWARQARDNKNWGPQDAEEYLDLVERLANRVAVHEMNGGWEIALELDLHKDTVLLSRQAQTGARRLVVIGDDKGDVKVMNLLAKLRTEPNDLDGLLLASGYPVDEEGRKPNADVLSSADLVLNGVQAPGEADRDFVLERIPHKEMSAQALFGKLLSLSVDRAHQKAPDVIPPSAVDAAFAPLHLLPMYSPRAHHSADQEMLEKAPDFAA